MRKKGRAGSEGEEWNSEVGCGKKRRERQIGKAAGRGRGENSGGGGSFKKKKKIDYNRQATGNIVVGDPPSADVRPGHFLSATTLPTTIHTHACWAGRAIATITDASSHNA